MAISTSNSYLTGLKTVTGHFFCIPSNSISGVASLVETKSLSLNLGRGLIKFCCGYCLNQTTMRHLLIGSKCQQRKHLDNF